MRFLDVVSMTQMEISVENMWAEDVWGLVQILLNAEDVWGLVQILGILLNAEDV